MKKADLNLLLTDLDLTPVKARYNLRNDLLPQLFTEVPESVKQYARELRDAGWKFLVADQDSGFCSYHYRQIVIPAWLFDIRKIPLRHRNEWMEYKTWYIAHELAHAYDKCVHNHGPQFMEWLKRICPSNCVKFELGYKPRNAKAAGIGKIDWDTML